MIGMLVSRTARADSAMAVICGTPAPVTMRVVQIDPGPMPTLMASAPARASSQAPSNVPTLPAMRSTSGNFCLDQLDGLKHARRVPVRAVDGQQVSLGLHHLRGALEEVAGRANGGADAQAALGVLRRVGILQALLDVLDGDQPLELKLIVDDQQLLHAMLVQDGFRVVQRSSDRNGDEVFLGHHFADGNVGAGFEAQIAIGEDADELLVLGYRHAGNAVVTHDLQRVGDLVIGRHGDGIDDHAAFRALHLVDFAGLLLDGEVAMDDAESALLRHCDGHAGFGHGVHGGADQRNLEHDVAGQAS